MCFRNVSEGQVEVRRIGGVKEIQEGGPNVGQDSIDEGNPG